jgi:hypothetical protein
MDDVKLDNCVHYRCRQEEPDCGLSASLSPSGKWPALSCSHQSIEFFTKAYGLKQSFKSFASSFKLSSVSWAALPT